MLGQRIVRWAGAAGRRSGWTAALLGALAAVAGPAAAQGTVRCTSDGLGGMVTTWCSDGRRITAEQVGGTTYVRDNTGRRATVESIAGTSYYRDNRGLRATAESYGGNTTYLRDNRGTRGTYEEYGGTGYYRDNQGVRGTVERYGTMPSTTWSRWQLPVETTPYWTAGRPPR
jgi:hypothetical protein